MLENNTYPSPENPNFQEEIYKKREFYIHSIPQRKKLDTIEKINDFRNNTCTRDFKLSETQSLLSNFINPDTPYKGILIYHGTGVGKTCAAVAIAEKFKPMVEKYGTRIHILVSGPLNKQNFLSEILKCTGETYLKEFQDKTVILNDVTKNKIIKNAYLMVNQYYRLISYLSFYKKVLGEKIREKVIRNDKIKILNRRTDSGEFERDISIDRITSLDNTLLIVDEAHNLTDNEFGDSVKKIIDSSVNLKIVLLTATPMKNSADQIIELINYLRPKDSQIEKNKIFTNQKISELEFKPGGQKYLRKMVNGYVSYLRGADPLTFAERIEIGEIPPGLSFTKLVRCYMLPFQLEAYNIVIETLEDKFVKTSESVANFVFPGLKDNKLVGFYGIDGMAQIRNQLHNPLELNKQIKKLIPNSSDMIFLNDKLITGNIYHIDYLKYFSIKFYTLLVNINETVIGKKGPGLLFIYSNLVRVGIDILQEILFINGYLEYQENINDYNIKKNTRCYYCDYKFGEHINNHKFYPATYIRITGKSEESNEQIPEEKLKILNSVFNNVENKEGKYIKIVLGSKVMNEGITLKNIKEIHIADVHFNLGKVDQVIGRGIRFCSHFDIINEENPYPKVDIYKYVVSIKDGLTTEEELYKKAEQKYILIKETERILQEQAIDCPLNINGNIFPEELEKYGNCGSTNNPCPAICGYLPCKYKCGDKLLNTKYYDPSKAIYKKISKANLDYSTYNISLASQEIDFAKTKIKEMYHINHIYTLNDIIDYVKNSFPAEKLDLFDNFYVYQAINDLIPITDNDFNNFHDTITDKFNRPGYLIYRNKYYIFQQFDENENIPMYYRRNYNYTLKNKLSIKDYIKNTPDFKNYKDNLILKENKQTEEYIFNKYDFNSVQDYYDNREEYDYVGIIDQPPKKRGGNIDEFKIRKKRPKFLIKKRETGIPSFTGAVCHTSKDKKVLIDIASKLNLNAEEYENRLDICNLIKNKLFDLEKYSTNKMTYLIIPANHPTIPFPLNLKDRINFIINKIKKETHTNPIYKIETIPKKGEFKDIKYKSYKIIFDQNMKKYGATKENGKWVINIL